MKHVLLFVILISLADGLSAQYVYTIKADSVKLTSCDSSELIIENHTQNVPGFLFNTGNGRTIFKRGVVKINGGLYLIGADTLNVGANAWMQGGNSFGATGVLGTLDNNHLDFITNDTQRVRLTKAGNWLIGDTADNGYKLHLKGGLFQDGGTFYKNYYTDVSSSSMRMGSGYELFGVNHSAGGYSLYFSGGINGDFSSGWDMAFGTPTNRIMAIDHQSINTNQPLKVNAGLQFPEQSSYMSSPYVGFQYASSGFWHWAVVNSSNVPNLVVRSNGNVVIGGTSDNGNKLQVNGSSLLSGNVYVNANNGDGTGQLFLQSSAGDYSNFIGSSQYNMLFQTRQTAQSFVFQFGSATNALMMQGNNGGNLVITGTKAINLVAVDTINGGSAGSIHLSSNNYNGNDGVVVERNSRSTLMTDPIFTIREKDTIVFNAQKNGFIGVGLSSPSAQFHTTGTVRFAGLTSDTTQTRVLVSDASGNLYYRAASTLAGNGMLSTDLANGSAVLPSLAVNGTISAQRMKLSQAGWPDYVFRQGYPLPALNEIEVFIQQHGHLPGIPSAAEVGKKGIDVGDQQAALLKKIEELTLYNIAQEKQLKDQDKRLEAQATELSALKQEMAEFKKIIIDRSSK